MLNPAGMSPEDMTQLLGMQASCIWLLCQVHVLCEQFKTYPGATQVCYMQGFHSSFEQNPPFHSDNTFSSTD